MTTVASRPGVGSGLRAGAFAAGLALAMAASTLAGFAIGILGPLIRTDLAITAGQLGLLATAFNLSGAMFSPTVGRQLAAFDSRRSLIGLFLFCIGTYAVIAASPSFATMLVAVWIAGISGAFSNPLTNQAIALHSLPGRRGLILGVKQSGVQVGVFLGGALLPLVAIVSGWRVAFVFAGVLPLLGLLLIALVLPRDVRPLDEASGPNRSLHLMSMLREYPNLRWLGAYALLMGASMSAVNTFLPLYAFDVLRFSVPQAGLVGSISGLLGIITRVSCGRRMEHRGPHLRGDLLVIGATAAAMAMVILAAASLGGAALWLGAAGLGAISAVWNVAVMMSLIRDLPARRAAPATGIVQLGFYIGLMTGPAGFGLVLAVSGGYTAAWIAVVVSFALACLLIVGWSAREARLAAT